MASQTLYRTFRPRRFSDVSGQPQVTDVLERQIEKNAPAHAYLFCGTRGTGKTTTARILANALNCLSPENGNPCGKCEVCRSFEQDSFVDVVEIDAASNNGVDNIRDIREKAALLPVRGKFKVYIIDEVHMLSGGAFNALLKTLEEPPPHTVFILATTEFRKIPKTIISRCQHFEFRRISDEDITNRLRFVAQSIGVDAEPEALTMLAAQADGALRDALSLMDQCLAGSASLTKQDVRATLGVSDNVVLTMLCDCIEQADPAGVLDAQRRITDDGTTPAHVLQDAITELSARLAKCGADTDRARALLRAIEVLISAQGSLRFSPAPSAVLTAALVRAALPSTDTDSANLALRVRKLEQMVEQLASGTASVPRVHPEPAPAKTPPAEKPAPKPHADAESPAQASADQSSGDSDAKLAQFRAELIARSDALEPPAATITSLEERPGEVVAHVREEDSVIAELLLLDSAAADLKHALEAVYGKPAPRFRIGSKKHTEQAVDDTQEIIDELARYVGRDNVDVIQ